MAFEVVNSRWAGRRWLAVTVFFSLFWALSNSGAQAAPSITDFSPTSGAPGTSVTINGSDLGGTSEVRFGSALAIFAIFSNNRVIATVPLDATSGPISIGSSSGTTASATSFLVAPRITDFSPISGPPGATILISGNNFEGATAVQFNGTNAASFSVTAPTQITAKVPPGATNGPITVTTPIGTAQSAAAFVVTGNEPFITSFSPTNGAPGTVVTITGGNFTGATVVRFNGTNAPGAAVTSPTQIRVTVPSSASTGPISVTSALGTGVSARSFVITTAPIITDFQPVGGPAGTVVVLNGANFLGATAVKFGGKDAARFSVTAATQINATVPVGATNGPISITTPLGTGVSSVDFLASAGPIITDFAPTNAIAGAIVTINGFNFTGTRSVTFGGATAFFGVTAPTQINATVPANATNGPITVTTAAGSASSVQSFFLRNGKPIIISFDPTTGLPRTVVTIDGSDFSGATAVKFNGTNAAFNVVSDSQISTLVPDNATTGPISITNPGGTTVSSNRFIVAPRLTSFTPASGIAGTNVTILGTNFTDVLAVRFNGIAASFTNSSPNQIKATVPNEATSGSISVTTVGGIVASTNAFLVLPSIASFTPLSGPVGTQVTILGTGFGNVTAISFGGVNATVASLVSSTQIVAVVPARAVTGPITVTTTSGAGTSAKAFTVGLTANLTLTQTESADPVLEAQPLTYTITVTNQGPSGATGVVISDTLDPDVSLGSATATSGSVNATGPVVNVTIPSFPKGTSVQLTVSVVPLLNGLITNLVSVTATEADPDLTDNSSTQTTTVLVNPAVLQVDELPSHQIKLSWPVTATNFVLQSASRISPSPNWQNVTVSPVVNGTRKNVTTPVGAGVQFYRLTKP